MITENLSTLKIHKLTQEQYNRELEAGRIDPSALYLTPDNNIYIQNEEPLDAEECSLWIDMNTDGSESADGEDGATFIPYVDVDGNLSWSNDKGMANPSTVNIKGYTPVRGIDYWTESDIAEIKSYVDEAILGGAW